MAESAVDATLGTFLFLEFRAIDRDRREFAEEQKQARLCQFRKF